MAVIAMVVVSGYGAWRLSAPSDEAGPKILGVQANIPMGLKHGRGTDEQILREHFLLTQEALNEHPAYLRSMQQHFDHLKRLWSGTRLRDRIARKAKAIFTR